MNSEERRHALFHDTLLDWPDTTGRLLGETASEAFDRPQDLGVCPYSGSRRGEPMNAGALGTVLARWPLVLEALHDQSGPTAADAWSATCRNRWACLWGPRPVPVETAVVFKTALGLHRPLTFWLLTNPGAAALPLFDLVHPDALGARLETEGWLHGSELVCSAPEEQIVEAWRALVSPTPPGPHPAAATPALVAGSWAVLGATRSLLRDGVLDEAPGWSPAIPPRDDWPKVLHLLAARGPGALVREVPHFEPQWASNVFAEVPDGLSELIEGAAAARTLRQLDAIWETFSDRLLSDVPAPSVRE